MSVKIITYDLNNESNRPDIVGDIKSYSSWARLSESSYAVSTSDTPTDIYNALKKHIDNDDQIYIVQMRKPWNGFGPKTINEWLNNNLT